MLDFTHDPQARSWVASAEAPDADFPLQNLPFGRFRRAATREAPRVGVAIGDRILDLAALGALDAQVAPLLGPLLHGDLNGFMAQGRAARIALRHALFAGLSAEPSGTASLWQARQDALLVPQDEDGRLPIERIVGEAGAAAVYCCGPEPLLTAVENAGAASGVAVHLERFAPKAVARKENRSFEVRLAGRGDTFRVGAEQSIADVLEAAGVPIVTSCREGTCGSCETGVLSGAVEHRDSLLTEDERARGDTMMLCVSRACSEVLVLDL